MHVLIAGGGLTAALALLKSGCEVEVYEQAAAALLEAPADDLVYERGEFCIAGTDRRISLFDVGPLAVGEDLGERIPAYPAGAAVCEVEIDPDTGRV